LTGKYSSLAYSVLNATLLWQKNVNARGGFNINGVNYQVEIIQTDSGGTTDGALQNNTRSAIRAIVNGTYGTIHAIFSPYSSELTGIAAGISEPAGIISIAAGASSENLYQCDKNLLSPCTSSQGRRYRYLYGMLSGSTAFFPPAVQLMKIKGAGSVGAFFEDSGATVFFHSGGLNSAIDNAISIVYNTSIPRIGLLDDTVRANIRNVVLDLKEKNPDFVLAAVYDVGCQEFIRQCKELNFSAKAFVISICVATPSQYVSALGDDGRYVMGPVQWNRQLTGRFYSETGDLSAQHFPSTDSEQSPQLFYDAFVKEFGVEPSYQAAAQYAGGMALQLAFERAGTLNLDEVNEHLSRVNDVSFYGLLQFTGGQLASYLGVTTQFDVENSVQVVTPLASQAVDVVYPMPTWNERVENFAWYSQGAEIGLIVVAGFGFLVCWTLIIIMCVWRERPPIATASVALCTICLAGTSLVFGSIFFWTLEVDNNGCLTRYWLFVIGFTMVFSVYFVKMYRVWLIQGKKRPPSYVLDWKFALKIMAVIISASVIVMILWSVIYPPWAITVVPDITRPIYNYHVCDSTNEMPFVITLIAYNGLIILFTLIMGLIARNVKTEYNESKYILIGLYNLCFAALVLLVLYIISIPDRYLDFLFRTVAILWGLYSSIAIIFLPKVYYSFADKSDTKKAHGRNMTTSMQHSSYHLSENTATDDLDKLRRKVKDLEDENAELKRKLLD
jgi:ABC-type branched-subunit amino acid transport system substrate-binding protein